MITLFTKKAVFLYDTGASVKYGLYSFSTLLHNFFKEFKTS